VFEYSFMIDAFIAGTIIAIIAPMLGTFVVIRRYSMITDTLAHSSLLGVSIGLLLSINPLITALIVAIAIAIAIEYLRVFHKMYSDSILAIFLSASLAFAIIIVSLSGSFNNSLFSYLFGTLLAVESNELYYLTLFSLIVIIFIYKNYYALQFISFDEDVAKVSGINTTYLNFILIILVAITVVLSIKIIGALLIGALSIIPVNSALQFKYGFTKTLFLSILIALVSVISGLTISYHYSLPSGASIVIVAVVIFLISLVSKKLLHR